MSGIADATVAIIGSGPAGIGAALALKARGIDDILIVEREAVAGGTPRHCEHPTWGFREFGRPMLGSAFAERLVRRAMEAGIRIETGASVTALRPQGEIALTGRNGPQTVTARRVVLATGARETPRSARLVGGDRPLGVITTGALQNLVYLRHMLPFQRPVIIGSELVSLSALSTCRGHGMRPVGMVEERAAALARWPLTLYPRLCGVPLHLDTQLREITGRDRVESVVLARADGTTFTLACDGVIFTGRFVPESSLVRMSHLAIDMRTKGPLVDQFGRCSDPSYFAAGNILRAVETGSWCHREGARIGAWVAKDLRDEIPIALRTVPIVSGKGISYAMPGRVAVTSVGGDITVQLRVPDDVSGRLIVRADGEVLVSRPVSTRPERRMKVTLRGGAIPFDCRVVFIDVSAGR